MAAKRNLMTMEEVQGSWVIIPTPAKPGADDWRARDTVDLDETARVVNALIEAGVDGIMSLGTLGECATLTWDEKKAFMGAMVEAARGRVPIFVGTTTLNTRDTIEQTRFAADLGASGTMLGLPMWCSPSVPVAVRYYRDVAEACPDTAICVYANPEAFSFDYPAPFWAQLADVPQIVSAKYLGLGTLLRDIGASRRRIRFMPVNNDYYGAARMEPDFCTAFWSGGAVCGPQVATGLRDEVIRAKASGDWSRARKLNDAAGAASALFMPPGGFKEFAMHNIGLEKARANAGGWMNAGPCRPPYHLTPAPLLENAAKSGQRWAEINAALVAGTFFDQ
jgi:trans-o-hydroxybenzylidenepyruvate hydratase-aldolase